MEDGRTIWAVVIIAAGPTGALMATAWRTVGENIIWLAAVAVACGVLIRQVIRPAWRRGRALLRKAHRAFDLLNTELAPDHGHSMKDQQVFQTTQIARVVDEMKDVRSAQQATAHVLDGLVRHMNEADSEIWAALHHHGIDRKKAS